MKQSKGVSLILRLVWTSPKAEDSGNEQDNVFMFLIYIDLIIMYIL